MATGTDPRATLKPPITVQQWGELDEGPRYDLVEGRLVEIPDVALWHEILLSWFAAPLIIYVRDHGMGVVVTSKAKLRIDAFGGREPDVFLIPADQYHLAGQNVFKGIPPLVVEILSPSNESTDRGAKAREYARLGVGQYWIVDFPARRIEVYALDAESQEYQLAEAVEGDAVFRPGLFAGLEIRLSEIWPTQFENAED